MFLPDDLVAAVGAHVVECVHGVVEVAGDHDRREAPGQVAGEVRTLARQPLDTTDAQPVSFEDRLAFSGEELLGDRILVIDRCRTEFGIVGGELAPAGRQWLLDALLEGGPSLCSPPFGVVDQGSWSQGLSSGAISPPNGKNTRWA